MEKAKIKLIDALGTIAVAFITGIASQFGVVVVNRLTQPPKPPTSQVAPRPAQRQTYRLEDSDPEDIPSRLTPKSKYIMSFNTEEGEQEVEIEGYDHQFINNTLRKTLDFVDRTLPEDKITLKYQDSPSAQTLHLSLPKESLRSFYNRYNVDTADMEKTSKLKELYIKRLESLGTQYKKYENSNEK
ncbi:MAG: hypothetical protein KAU41_08660 [Deltaproteobacteria bacterium]|nr:hypothetical protein [Deltaproteobacteria bacterium]